MNGHLKVELEEVNEPGRIPTVGELMTPDPIVIDESAMLDDAVRLLEENEISGLPVVDRDGVLVGVISHSDVIRARAVSHLWHR